MEHADLAFGRHPRYGIVAHNTRDLPAGAWMLDRLDFRPVPGHSQLYALTGHPRDGEAHTAQAVAMLRGAGYTVAADAEFQTLDVGSPAPRLEPVRAVAPDVAFAEHPRLGIVAAVDDQAPRLGVELLERHGWRHNPSLDIYTLPFTTRRGEALDRLATTTVAMLRAEVLVAVEPRLAQTVLRHRAEQQPHRTRDHSVATGRSAVSAAALARSPAASALAQAPPAAATAEPTTRPVDPRIAFSRSR